MLMIVCCFFKLLNQVAGHIYEKASGQTVNFEKLNFMVSPNTSSACINTIKNILKVHHQESLGQYLGLPSQNARNKKDISDSIKD